MSGCDRGRASRKPVRRWCWLGGGSLFLALGLWWGWARAGVTTVTASSGAVDRFVIVRATVVPQEGIAEVRPQVGGRVLHVYAEEGDRVDEGQLLAEIESATERAQLSRVEAEHLSLAETAAVVAQRGEEAEVKTWTAEVAAAEQGVALAEERAQRQRQLFDSGAGAGAVKDETERQLEIAKARLQIAQARLSLALSGAPHEVEAAKAKAAAAQAGVEAAQQRVEWCRVTAPISGVVLRREADPGDIIVATAAFYAPVIFAIADTTRLELRAEVEERDVHQVKVGQDALVTGRGGRPTLGQAKVVRVAAAVQESEVRDDPSKVRSDGPVLPVYLRFAEKIPPALPVGQRLEAKIFVSGNPVATRVPRQAVSIREGRAWVQVPGLLLGHKVRVRLGEVGEQFVEVAGLEPGTPVAVQTERPGSGGESPSPRPVADNKRGFW